MTNISRNHSWRASLILKAKHFHSLHPLIQRDFVGQNSCVHFAFFSVSSEMLLIYRPSRNVSGLTD